MAGQPVSPRPTRDESDAASAPRPERPTLELVAPSSARERAPLDAAAAQPDFTQSGGASDADLEQQIEALKAFLARYPLTDRAGNGTTERAPAPPRTESAVRAQSTSRGDVTPVKVASSAAAMPAIEPLPASAPDAPPAVEPPVAADHREVLPPSASPEEPASAIFEAEPPVAPEQPPVAAWPPATEPPAFTEPSVTEPLVEAERPAHGLAPQGLFASHAEDATTTRVGPLRTSRRTLVVAAVIITLVALLFAGISLTRSALGGTTGTLSVDTNPVGVPVLVDGESRGVTPLEIDLPVGEHLVEIVSSGVRRTIPVTITPGAQVSHFLELGPAVSDLGELLVRTDVPGVPVLVDGRPVGRSPVTVRDLAPGAHSVVLQHESGSVTERVVIESGRTASLVASTTKPRNGVAAGWISISVPADVQIYEKGQLLGSSRIERIMLPVGRHELELVNDALGFRQSQTVHVAAGEVSRISPPWPQGSLALNAIPWAEVWMGGAMVGETPIGNLSVPIGVHEIVFRHPELGERRATVTVTMREPTKVGIDLGAK